MTIHPSNSKRGRLWDALFVLGVLTVVQITSLHHRTDLLTLMQSSRIVVFETNYYNRPAPRRREAGLEPKKDRGDDDEEFKDDDDDGEMDDQVGEDVDEEMEAAGDELDQDHDTYDVEVDDDSIFGNQEEQEEGTTAAEEDEEDKEGNETEDDTDATATPPSITTATTKRTVIPTSTRALTFDENKPFMVIHVGPPKTATTTLQESLESMRHVLALDNYTYARHGPDDLQWHKIFDYDCGQQMNDAHQYWKNTTTTTTTTTTSTLKQTVHQLDCWKDRNQIFQKYHRQGQHILFSDELIGMRFRKYNGVNHGRSALDWVALQEAVQDDWNLLVVVAYRRYMEWLPSAIYQQYKWTASKPTMNLWPTYERNARGNMRRVGLGDDINADAVGRWKNGTGGYPFRYLDKILDGFPPTLPVAMINNHDPKSIPSTFLCDILPRATQSCQHSLQLDQQLLQLSSTSSSSKNSTKSSVLVVNQQKPLAYDMLAMAAKKEGLIQDDTLMRRTVSLRVQHYQERTLKLTAKDFPVVCPTEHDLQAFLNYSLQLEAQLMPDFYNSSLGKAAHVDDFQTNVRKNKYCWIDTKAVLQAPHWQSFFANLKTDDSREPSATTTGKQKRKRKRKNATKKAMQRRPMRTRAKRKIIRSDKYAEALEKRAKRLRLQLRPRSAAMDKTNNPEPLGKKMRRRNRTMHRVRRASK